MSCNSKSRFFRFKRKATAAAASSLPASKGPKQQRLQAADLTKNDDGGPTAPSSSLQRKLSGFSAAASTSSADPPEDCPTGDGIEDHEEELAAAATSGGKRKRTPLEDQVIGLKSDHPGVLLMIECGYRYRFFGDDAQVAAKVLDIQAFQDGHGTGHFLTASVPIYLGADRYIRKLVAAGHKVGVVSQTETAAEKKVNSVAKGPFQRKLTAVYTATTLLGLNSLGTDYNLDESGWIMALVQGHGGELAIACAHPLSGDVLYDVFTAERSNLEQRLVLIQPKEIVVNGGGIGAGAGIANSGSEPELAVKEQLYRFVREREDGSPGRLEELQPSSFDDLEALNEALTAAAADGNEDVGIGETSQLAKLWPDLSGLSTKSFAGLHAYLAQFDLQRSLVMSNKVRRFAQGQSNRRMRLPALTIRNLELFGTAKKSSKANYKGCLFSLLDKTQTKFGSRMLREWVCGPLLIVKDIEKRLDAVEYFVKNQENAAKSCREMLKGLPDLEQALIAVVNLKIRTRDFCKTIVTIDAVSKKLAKVWRSSEDLLDESVPKLLEEIVASATEAFRYNQLILSQINADFGGDDDKNGGGNLNALKSWKKYPAVCERLEEIAVLEEGLDKHKSTICKKLGWLMFRYTTVSDQEYLIEVKVKDAKSVPGSWTKVSATKQVVRFRSEFVNESLPKLQYARERLTTACNRAWADFLKENVENFRLIVIGVRSLAKLDALLAMAAVSAQDGFCRPVFSSQPNRVFRVENGRNLTVEAALSGRAGSQYVPNDVDLNGEERRALILTGPNMGGKSCYIRQMASCALMAQTGFFVPATRAQLPVFDGLYLRIGARDDMWSGRSTLMVELQEASLMMNEATDRSLVLIDELGRGTSTHDGAAIARAVLTHFIHKIRCQTVFVTHYKSLTTGDYVTKDKVARNGHMSFHTVDEDHLVLFLYKLAEGPCANSFGINVAQMAGLPGTILNQATEIAASYENKDGGGWMPERGILTCHKVSTS